MFRAITLIETLITLALIVISIYFISPVVFRVHDSYLVENELDHITSFIYQIQSRARYTKTAYSINLVENRAEKRWCMVAIQKQRSQRELCNCFQLSACPRQAVYQLYSIQSEKVEMKTNKQFPQYTLDIDGLSGGMEEGCLKLRNRDYEQILQFDPRGVINVAQPNARTECKHL